MPGNYFITKKRAHMVGLLLFQSNFAPADTKKNSFIRNTFCKDILCRWCSLNYDKEPNDIDSQILWNNSHIKSHNKHLAFSLWIHKGILMLKIHLIVLINVIKHLRNCKMSLNFQHMNILIIIS